MTSAFILTLNVGDDTDLIGIADEISTLVQDHFPVIDCKPWAHPTTAPNTLRTQPQQP